MQNEVFLYETDFWKIILIDNQSYFGRSIVILKRECGELSKISPQEWVDFHENVVKKLESVFKKIFNATMFNWTCLMNNAFKAENPKPRVHWHFRPRYKKEVKFAGEQFQDLDFAHHYNRKRKMIVSKNILEKISKEVKKHL